MQGNLHVRFGGRYTETCYGKIVRRCVPILLLKNNVDIRYIAQLLGHESLNTTKRYLVQFTMIFSLLKHRIASSIFLKNNLFLLIQQEINGKIPFNNQFFTLRRKL